MDKSPNIYCLGTLIKWVEVGPQAEIEGKWYPARPLGLDCWRNRLHAALMVFKGEADAVIWPGGQ